MRHNVYGKKLSRDKNQRTALFKNLVRSLIIHESIQTTDAKAKAIKGTVDKIINQAKTPTTRRLVSQFLVDKAAQEKLIKEIIPRLGDRTSGYTSVVRIGRRLGDGAMIVRMSLIEGRVKEAPARVEKKEKKEAAQKKVVTKKAPVKKETK